jgi:hypothetical protein
LKSYEFLNKVALDEKEVFAPITEDGVAEPEPMEQQLFGGAGAGHVNSYKML